MLACLLQQLVLAYLPLLCLLCKAKAQAWHRAKSIQRKECLSASHKVSFCQPSYTALISSPLDGIFCQVAQRLIMAL